MQRILTLALVLCFCSFVAFGQTVTVSEPITIRNDIAYDIVGKLKGRILLFRDRENEFEVQAFNEKMEMSWNKQMEFEKKRVDFIGTVASHEDFHLFYQYKKKGHVILKMHRYDAAANLLDSITIKDFGVRLHTPNFRMVLSEDKRKVLLYFFEDMNEFEAYSLDLDAMKVLWSHRFRPSDWFMYRDFRQVVVNNKGVMYFISEKDNRSSRKKDHHFEICEFHEGLTEIRTVKVPIEEHLTYDVSFSFDNLNNKLVAAGLYSKDNRARAVGFYYLNVPMNNPEARILSFTEFEKKFASTIMDKKKENKIKGISEADIQQVVLRQDGGLLMVGERNKLYERRMSSTTRAYSNNTPPGGVVDYYFDDIFVISVHPDGKLHWQKVLHKRQYSQDDDAMYSSFFLLKNPSAIRFLFNDEIRYENTVSEYILNGDGNSERNSIFSTDSQEIRLRFRDGQQVASNEILVPSERRHKLKLVKVTY